MTDCGSVWLLASSPHNHHHAVIATPSSPRYHHHAVINTPSSLHRHHRTIITPPSSLCHHHRTVITVPSSPRRHCYTIITASSLRHHHRVIPLFVRSFEALARSQLSPPTRMVVALSWLTAFVFYSYFIVNGIPVPDTLH